VLFVSCAEKMMVTKNTIRVVFTGVMLISQLIAQGQTEKQYTINEIPDLLYVKEGSVQCDSLQRLNLVLPQDLNNHPLLIWIGGGAWSYGDRNVEMDLARNLSKRGIGVASVGHRLSPAVWRDSSLHTGIQHPKHMEDVATAVKWIYENAPNYGYDTSKLFIGGFSSGAHLAALAVMDSTYLLRHGLSPHIFKGVIPISGTYDLPNYRHTLKNGSRPELAELHVDAVFGGAPQDLVDASPIHYLENLSVPMLLMCDNDLYNYTRLFEDRIRETNFRNVRVVYAYNRSHGGLWRDISRASHSTYRNVIISFVKDPSKL
jgi:hypothetical protein